MEAIPQREGIRARITELWNFERFSAPSKVGGKYLFSKNNGLQNQSVLYIQDTLDSEPRLLLDPNAWSKDGTVALAGFAVSDDGKYAAYGRSESGSDWQTWGVLDVATGKPLSDELKWVKFSGASWTVDGKGFFYSRFPEPTGRHQGRESCRIRGIDQQEVYVTIEPPMLKSIVEDQTIDRKSI